MSYYLENFGFCRYELEFNFIAITVAVSVDRRRQDLEVIKNNHSGKIIFAISENNVTIPPKVGRATITPLIETIKVEYGVELRTFKDVQQNFGRILNDAVVWMRDFMVADNIRSKIKKYLSLGWLETQ